MLFTNNTTALVKQILTKNPKTRDDDKMLVAVVWHHLLGAERLQTESAMWLLKKYVQGDLPNAESIRRTRQKLQEKHSHLRGEKYEQRQEKLEPAVRKEVRAWR